MIDKDFYPLWQREVVSTRPFDMAVEAGRVAENPGLIFIAGYQAAIRATFPGLEAKRWYSFAVSEDRSADSSRPGVTLEKMRVSGWKTWIAAVDCVDALVLKVGSGRGAQYGVVEVSDPGVELTTKPHPAFLPTMSQGAAQFTDARFSPLTDCDRVARFREFEPAFIYVALLARLTTLELPLSEQAQAILDVQATELDFSQLDLSIQDVLTQMTESGVELGDNWQTDRRLFTMYSR